MVRQSLKQREQEKGYMMAQKKESPDAIYWPEDSDRDDFAKSKDSVGSVKISGEGSGYFYSWITEDRIREIVREEISKKK